MENKIVASCFIDVFTTKDLVEALSLRVSLKDAEKFYGLTKAELIKESLKYVSDNGVTKKHLLLKSLSSVMFMYTRSDIFSIKKVIPEWLLTTDDLIELVFSRLNVNNYCQESKETSWVSIGDFMLSKYKNGETASVYISGLLEFLLYAIVTSEE